MRKTGERSMLSSVRAARALQWQCYRPSFSRDTAAPEAAPGDVVKLRVKAGFGALVARDSEPPDWHFDDDICMCNEQEEGEHLVRKRALSDKKNRPRT